MSEAFKSHSQGRIQAHVMHACLPETCCTFVCMRALARLSGYAIKYLLQLYIHSSYTDANKQLNISLSRLSYA